jgi:hypothetical protein
MQLPKVHGVIGRRLLVNFRAEPGVVQRRLPLPFRAKLHDGHAVAGICLIRLDDIRPKRFPRMLGLSSENAAHRIAVLWDDDDGSHEGVYIPRARDDICGRADSGGSCWPGDSGATDDVDFSDRRRGVGVLRARLGRLLGHGFRPTARRRCLEDAFVERGTSGDRTRVFQYFADETVFPTGTVTFDCALIMRNIAHEWQAGAPMYI